MNRFKHIFAILGVALFLSCSDDVQPIDRMSAEDWAAAMASSSSSSEAESSSSAVSGVTFEYCNVGTICYQGPYALNDCSVLGGMPSNNCPSGSNVIESSSSSAVLYSSSVSSSSSSVVLSSSSSSFSLLSSSSSVVPSSSSVVPSSSSLSSSSAGISSSSSATPSSSSNSVSSSSSVGGSSTCGANFKTVKIGTQTWMAENLNCEVSGSKCYGNDEANCAIYGRLYDWSTAMSVCPSGWHLPTNADWDKLLREIDGTSGTSSPYNSTTAGKYLKAKEGWNPYSGIENLDTHGFAALPGSGYSGGSFSNVGYVGYWWSASEYDSSSHAYIRGMNYDNGYALYGIPDKSDLLSVRCLQD